MKRKMLCTPVMGIVVLATLVAPAVASAGRQRHIKAMMGAMNDELEAMGQDVQLVTVEYYTAWAEAGKTVYFDNRALRMGSHWVPFDPRRWGVQDIYWLSDQIEGTANGVTPGQTQAAVAQAMNTWDSVICSDIPLTKLADLGLDWGYVQYLVGMGGIAGWYADITHAGWLPGVFFDIIAGPGGSGTILGATFTFIWIYTDTGEPTDIDNNGKMDVAFREIYYNNNFPWGIDTDWPIDVETVVLHEAGHGLSQGHFGRLFETEANGKLHFAPRAVMNAGYTGVQQELSGTDLASHCSIWAAWPNK